jgi:hypothetical protein
LYSYLVCVIQKVNRSQWPRGLRRRSTATRLLRSWVLIPQDAWVFVCCVCCKVEVSATSCSLVQTSPTDCGASLCVIKKPRRRGGDSPRWAVEPEKIVNSNKIENVKQYYLQDIPIKYNSLRPSGSWTFVSGACCVRPTDPSSRGVLPSACV